MSTVADLGEGLGGPSLPYFGKKKEEKPQGSKF